MGQRHQLFIIAEVGSRYRVLAALHHQWLYGLTAVQQCLQVITFLQAERNQDEIDTTRIQARTSDKRVGWVPQNTQPGDLVTLIRGAPFPFILRPVDGEHYSIVRDAYIGDIMQGEACPEAEDDWITLAIK
jgi:hypothetical protein